MAGALVVAREAQEIAARAAKAADRAWREGSVGIAIAK
jgi:hypothetical protein